MRQFLIRAALAVAATGPLLSCDPDGAQAPGSEMLALDAAATTGFRTSQPSQATALLPNIDLLPLVTVGDQLPGGLSWNPVPDGLGAYRAGEDLVLFANHELTSSGVKDTLDAAQFPYARVSRVVFNLKSRRVTGASNVVDDSRQYSRLCSATFVGASEGFQSGFFLTGEESVGGLHDGIQLAVGKEGAIHELPWLGRYNHENQSAVPGFHGKVVLAGFDDTRGASELYLYVARSEADVLSGAGKLYVFTLSGIPNVAVLQEGEGRWGRFVEVLHPESLSSSALQTAVNDLGAFPFLRLEDGEYDKVTRPGQGPAIYFVDTGSDVLCNGVTCDPYGSIYRMEFDPKDVTRARLILLQRSAGWQSGWASPDNIATSTSSLMVQEDPATPTFARSPQIYRFALDPKGRLGDGRGEAVVALNNPNCVDAQGTCWESSGIIDASAWYGRGAWLFDVQAHSAATPALGLVAENGQLLFMRVPGS